MNDALEQNPWEAAKQLASLIGLGPNAITTCIRLLRKDVEQNNNFPGKLSQYCLHSLLRGHTIKSSVYYAALTYRPGRTGAILAFNTPAFWEVFTAEELATILGMVLLFRRIKAGVKPESFAPIANAMHAFTDIGGHLGEAIPAIGLSRGILLGAVRHLASAMFLGIDEKGFVKFIRKLRGENKFFNPEAEIPIWHCSHAHIASYIVQILGLGVSEANALAQGLLPTSLSDAELPRETFRIKIAALWIEQLYRTGAPPSITHRGEYYPLAADLKRLVDAVAGVRKDGSRYSWLAKGRNDISHELTPALYDDTGRPLSARPASPESPPKEIFNQLSVEEIRGLEEEDPE